MLQSYKDFRAWIANLLESQGVDVMYLAAILGLIVSFKALKKVKNWDKLDDSDRFLVRSIFFATSVAIVGSILHFAGYF